MPPWILAAIAAAVPLVVGAIALARNLRGFIVPLWAAQLREADVRRIAKGLDKLETILQHSQGANPPGFDLAYNLGYARPATAADPLLAAFRARLDDRTRARLAEDAAAEGPSPQAIIRS